MLALLVRMLGHEAVETYDGMSALGSARRLRPDIVLLDLGLPGLDGFEVASALRREFGSQLRIVAVTGSGRDSDRERAREAGFDQLILKPIDQAFLQSLLH